MLRADFVYPEKAGKDSNKIKYAPRTFWFPDLKLFS